MYVVQQLKILVQENVFKVYHNELGKGVRIKHTNPFPNFFDMDELFSDYISNHNKKFDSYLDKYDCELTFTNERFTHHVISEIENASVTFKHFNISIFHLKRFFFSLRIEYFTTRGHKFSNILTYTKRMLQRFFLLQNDP